MAEFERLFKLWERSKNIINKQMFYFEMEKDYQTISKRVTQEYMRDLEQLENERETQKPYRTSTMTSHQASPKEGERLMTTPGSGRKSQEQDHH